MSIKAKISYTEEQEKELILRLLKPIIRNGAKVKESTNGGFKNIYIVPKNKK